MQNVKSTMINYLLSSLAPHYCRACGEIGTALCDNCKYDISCEDFYACIACGQNSSLHNICINCTLPYDKAWCVGERSSTLERLIDDFKFYGVYDAHRSLGDLLLGTISQLPPETIIVPVPTVSSHVRERGYDHTALIARYMAKRRGLKMRRVLRRVTSTKQRDAGRQQRITQAKAAFAVNGEIDSSVPYLLVDDVVTTGATIYYAAATLRTAGAREVWVAVIARQPLD